MEKLVEMRKAGRERRYCSQIQYYLIVLLVPMMIFLLGAGALTTQARTNSPLFETQLTSAITEEETYVLGETFKLGNLQYKINSVRTLDGQGIEVKLPREGNTFLLVGVTIENMGSSDVEVRSTIGFKLRDQAGKRQSSSIGAILAVENPLGGTIRAGEKMTGELGYEVLKGDQTFDLKVIRDPLSPQSEIATVQIPMP